MRTIALLSLLSFSLVAAAQSRRDDFDTTAYEPTSMVVSPLADGGCEAVWCGQLVSDDAGTMLRACTGVVELKATINVNRCAALAAAGAPRVLRELRFAVDAGAP